MEVVREHRVPTSGRIYGLRIHLHNGTVTATRTAMLTLAQFQYGQLVRLARNQCQRMAEYQVSPRRPGAT